MQPGADITVHYDALFQAAARIRQQLADDNDGEAPPARQVQTALFLWLREQIDDLIQDAGDAVFARFSDFDELLRATRRERLEICYNGALGCYSFSHRAGWRFVGGDWCLNIHQVNVALREREDYQGVPIVFRYY
jgi:hypothetical protein